MRPGGGFNGYAVIPPTPGDPLRTPLASPWGPLGDPLGTAQGPLGDPVGPLGIPWGAPGAPRESQERPKSA